MKSSLVYTLLLLFSFAEIRSQIDGLWQIEKVLVGTEEMTPVAKWSEFKTTNLLDSMSEGTVINGNGGIINFRGKWNYDQAKSSLTSFNEEGHPDDYGPFQVELDADKMTWRRTEEGQSIEVCLSRVSRIPEAPWDQVVGLWRIVENNGSEEYPLGEKWFMRWDRVFVRRANEDNRVTQNGIWHIHGHRPQLTLWSNYKTESNTVWTISFEKNSMCWVAPEKDLKITFEK